MAYAPKNKYTTFQTSGGEYIDAATRQNYVGNVILTPQGAFRGKNINQIEGVLLRVIQDGNVPNNTRRSNFAQLKSTNLYTINPKYIVGYKPEGSHRHYDRSHRHIPVPDRSVLVELPYKLTELSNFIKGLAESGSDKETILKKIAYKFKKEQLQEFINKNDNPWLAKKALEIKEDSNKNYVPKSIILKEVDNLRKKTNYFYKNKVAKNKQKYGRISAPKSFLSKPNKKK